MAHQLELAGLSTGITNCTSYVGSAVSVSLIVIREGALGLAGDLQVDAEGQQEAGREANRRHHIEFLRTG